MTERSVEQTAGCTIVPPGMTNSSIKAEKMTRFIQWLEALPSAKIAVVAAFAIIGAALPKDLSARDRVATFYVGFMAAMVFGEPLRDLLGLPEPWTPGMAGILAMTGRNIAVFVIRASRDPAGFAKTCMEIWRGNGGGR